ncbi:DUF6282 family protein [Paractinoplanes brasiliensis]|uniref:Uncharacterized protein n=1 Tax=Paractinoplanes brasiliensis TaxID=52695 RepID=A0A4R6JB42_9ACTN|nr:DUF6282 family protein [Actinoplanes brasiliensis]TDO31686.1 hypothetical protein C8E87_7113 [Actinoplanes brasiliensis]GID30720.1 hypothetical protein Abr02nite_57030 [Actinoplanes brasiliensis]
MEFEYGFTTENEDRQPDEQADSLLVGAVDLHQHPGPSPFPRRMSILDAARDAAAYGYRAIVAKSHHHSMVTDILALRSAGLADVTTEVYGGVALNRTVGGLNPYAVELALRMGGRMVWFPTLSSTAHVKHHEHHDTGFPTPEVDLRPNEIITILDDTGAVLPEVRDILDVIAAEQAVLTCGHLGVEESDALIGAALEAGVSRIVVNHPIFVVGASIEQAVAWARKGVTIEHCVVMYFGREERRRDLDELLTFIKEVGVERTVLSSDSGQKNNPLPVTLFRRAVRGLLDAGIGEDDIRRLVGTTAGQLLAP